MIEIERVSKHFGRVPALRDVCLQIAAGERVALVGTNGSGKTTLLRALLGLIRVEGQIRIAGIDVAAAPERALRELAYVPQISPPIDAPVREVLATFAALRGIAEQACIERAAGLGLDLVPALALRFRDLSGGMRQKLLAAMALAAEPPILVCDEPTANLDARARSAFLAQLDQRPSGSILIVCSHHEEDVRPLVGRVIELRDGAVVSDAAPRPISLKVPA
jgi:ABC-type multidrug transport system ATPase subunit